MLINIKKSFFLVSLLIIALFSSCLDVNEIQLENKEKSSFFSGSLDGDVGTLIHGWAVTGESTDTLQSDILNDFEIDSDGNIFAVGSFSDSEEIGDFDLNYQGGIDGYLSKISEKGIWLNARTFSSMDDISLDRISINSAGLIAIAGHFSGSTMSCDDFSIENKFEGGGYSDIFVATLDDDFNCLWLSSVGGEQDDSVEELLIAGDGSVFLGGMIQDIVYFDTQGTDGLDEDGFICKFSNQGEITWAHRINGLNDQKVNTIFPQDDGSILVGGASDDNAEIDGGGENKSSSEAGFILKLNSDGSIVTLESIPGEILEIRKSSQNSDIFIGGSFSGMKNFGTINAQSSGYRDGFISKYIYPNTFSNFY
mgnify:CR=1 FL=1